MRRLVCRGRGLVPRGAPLVGQGRFPLAAPLVSPSTTRRKRHDEPSARMGISGGPAPGLDGRRCVHLGCPHRHAFDAAINADPVAIDASGASADRGRAPQQSCVMIASDAGTSKSKRMPMRLMTSLAALLMLLSSAAAARERSRPIEPLPQAVLSHPNAESDPSLE